MAALPRVEGAVSLPRNQPQAQCTSSLPASLSILAAGFKAEWHSAPAPALTPSAPQDSVQQDRQGVSHDHYLKYRPDRRCHRLGCSSHRPSFRSNRPAHRRRPRSRSLRLRFASRRVHSRSPRLAAFQESPGTVSSQCEEALASSLPFIGEWLPSKTARREPLP